MTRPPRDSLLLLALWIVAACAAVVAHNFTLDNNDWILMPESIASLPTPTPTPTTTPFLAPQVLVHVLERYMPFASSAVVGPLDATAIPADYRLVLTFKAFARDATNAAAMDCFAVDKDSNKWTPWTDQTPAASPGFCVARGLPDDPTTAAVATFQKTQTGGVLVLAAQKPTAAVLADAKARGWLKDPLTSFRVTLLKIWQASPELTAVSSVQVAKAATKEEAATQCQPDADGRADRKIEGGNFYAGDAGDVFMLCVSYLRRALPDIGMSEFFVSELRFVDRVFWRLHKCPFGNDGVSFAKTFLPVTFSPRKGKKRLLCFTPRLLGTNKHGETQVLATSKVLKRVFIDETHEKKEERLRVEYHGEDAFKFPPLAIDWNVVNAF